MNKNFFELQRHYKRNSRILYALFILAMMAHVLLALFIFMVVWWILFKNLDEFAWFWVVILVPSYFLFSVLYHYNKLINHHDVLLKDMNVKRLFVNTSEIEVDDINDSNKNSQNVIYVNHVKEFPSIYRRYYEFSQQLAIACGIPIPKIYVMDEQGINAFVAGFHDKDMMLVLSEGALKLDNESLYGLIGHEYGHIIHGDARLNMRMYVLMSGLSWLYDVADGLEWLSKWRQNPKVNRISYHDNKGNKQEYVVVTGIGRLSIEFISLLVRLVGFLGMASSEYIKTHFNQQREFLADATSIQLTRSDGVLKLLNTIRQAPYLARTNRLYTTHLSYFFFLSPKTNHQKSTWREQAGGVGSTHPENDERISALKEGLYDDFAKMAVQNLSIDFLKNTHDAIVMKSYDDIEIMDYERVNPHKNLVDNTHQAPKNLPIYHQEIELSQDKVVNGRFVRDDSWNKDSEDLIFPLNAKADYELKGVRYVSDKHIKNMHLPLMIAKFLRNDNIDRHQSKLFELFYAIILCHDSDVVSLNNDIYTSNLLQICGNINQLIIDNELLKSIATMDRRIDNSLLVIIYQRISQDLRHNKKHCLLNKDYLSVMNLLHHYHRDVSSGFITLWRGVHFYRLLSLFINKKDVVIPHDLNNIYQKYKIDINDFSVMVLIIYVAINHHQGEKMISTIHRLFRLLGKDIITDDDINHLIDFVNSWCVVDVVLLLLNYDEENTSASKIRIETLHTALLSDGVLCELEYEVLFVLHEKWCQGLELVIDEQGIL